jgi:HEAT repeat protein
VLATWDQIIADLHSPDVDRYVAACEAIDRAAERQHLPQLRDLLISGRDFTIREAAAEPVARMEGAAALRALLHAMRLGTAERHDNDGLNATILDVVERDPIGAAPVLRELFASPDPEDRLVAVWLWGCAGGGLDVDPPVLDAGPLLQAARDEAAAVRALALDWLGANYRRREDVYAALLAGLIDPVASVRVGAVRGLGYFGDRRARGAVDALAADPDAEVRQAVAQVRDKLTAEPPEGVTSDSSARPHAPPQRG